MPIFYLSRDRFPLLIKHDQRVSYLPVFESAKQAEFFANENNLNGTVMVDKFSFAVYRVAAAEQAEGQMLFVFPMPDTGPGKKT